MFSKDVYTTRRSELREKMNDGLGLFIGNNEAPMNYPANTCYFMQNIDFTNYYDNLEKYMSIGEIKIEDDILITRNGCKVLGNPIPKTVEEIETLCS